MMTRTRRSSARTRRAAPRESRLSKESDHDEHLSAQEEQPQVPPQPPQSQEQANVEDLDSDDDDTDFSDDELSFKQEFITKLVKIHSKTWGLIFCPALRTDAGLTDFNNNVLQLRKDFLECCICHELVSDQALICKSSHLKHGPVCKECVVKYDGCHCGSSDCTLTLGDFTEDQSFTIVAQSFKRSCHMFMRTSECLKLLELRVTVDADFDGIGLVEIIREGAMKGIPSLKSLILAAEASGDGLSDDDDTDFNPDQPGQCTTDKGNVQETSDAAASAPTKGRGKNKKISSKTKSPGKKNEPIIKLPPCKKWEDGNNVFTYNAGGPPQYGHDVNMSMGSNGVCNSTLDSAAYSTSTGALTSSGMTELPCSSGSVKSSQKQKHSESPRKKSKCPGKGKKDEHIKPLSCRCGNAAANPGKLTCCGQRCPCYVDGKGCMDCKCKGCRNPHLPGGKKLLQGLNAVIDTRTNETLPLQVPYITTQFFSNPNGQMMQPIFPLSASVASFNSFIQSIPVLSVSPIMQHQQQPPTHQPQQ